jgi:hypothetical protein
MVLSGCGRRRRRGPRADAPASRRGRPAGGGPDDDATTSPAHATLDSGPAAAVAAARLARQQVIVALVAQHVLRRAFFADDPTLQLLANSSGRLSPCWRSFVHWWRRFEQYAAATGYAWQKPNHGRDCGADAEWDILFLVSAIVSP